MAVHQTLPAATRFTATTQEALSVSTIKQSPWRIARKAFDHALNQELQEVIQQAKQMAAEVKEPYELWELEQYLTQRRKEIDRKYDYRYSQLTLVFGKLLHEGRLGEQELRGLSGDKLEAIRSYADFLARVDVDE
jgi:hypothetical protein